MLKSDCAHLKRVDRNNIFETGNATLKCDVDRAAPDSSTRAGISCPPDCMAYRPTSSNGRAGSQSAIGAIKKAFLSLIGK